jgi:superfamily II DNA/RNA helicase
VYQATLASATLSEDVLSLKSLVLHNPVILKLQEPELPPATQLTHYHLAAEEDEKAAILYALLKLRLVRGKSIIFVNSVDRCYKYVNVCSWLNKLSDTTAFSSCEFLTILVPYLIVLYLLQELLLAMSEVGG